MLANAATLRPATPDDADDLVRLINYAGEGMPYHVWQKNAEEGLDPWEFGRIRARRQEGAFTYRNAMMADHANQVAGCLVTYPLPETPEPIDYDRMPAMFVPLQELENLAPDTQYVNVLAMHPEFRSKGIGSILLAEAERIAGDRSMSIIVSDGNHGARRLYERTGYVEIATRPIVKDDGWDCDGENWVLLVKP